MADFKEGCHPAESFTDSLDMENAGNVLIRGEILLPKPKKVVDSWEFKPVEGE